MRRIRISVMVALMLMIAAIAPAGASEHEVTINMNAQNDSGQSGTATLTETSDGQTVVTLDIASGEAGVEQPAHIHPGTCADLDPSPAYPLNNVVDGMSETTVDVSLADLTTGTYAINVHMSAEEVAVYVSCGDIPMADASGDDADDSDDADDAKQVAPAAGSPYTDGGNGASMTVMMLILLGTAATGAGLMLRWQQARA